MPKGAAKTAPLIAATHTTARPKLGNYITIFHYHSCDMIRFMTSPATRTRICKFPGCRQAVEQAAGAPGRPGEYCDDPEHTAVRAWRARRAGTVATAGEPNDMGRPVAMATARAGMLRDDLIKTAEQLGEQLARAVEEMRTLTDPAAAAAQVETVAAEAAQQVAAADVARNRAEALAWDAKSELAEANEAAQQLEDQLRQAALAGSEADRLRQGAVDELAAATAVVSRLAGDLAAARGERDELLTRADEQARELALMREQLHAETRRAEEATARADRERASAERSIGQLETRLTDSTARAGDLVRQLTASRDELDTAHAAQARLEAQLAAATQRAEEATGRGDRADTARAEADGERATAEKAAARLEAQLEQTRERIAELTADRDRLTVNMIEATGRDPRPQRELPQPVARRPRNLVHARRR